MSLSGPSEWLPCDDSGDVVSLGRPGGGLPARLGLGVDTETSLRHLWRSPSTLVTPGPALPRRRSSGGDLLRRFPLPDAATTSPWLWLLREVLRLSVPRRQRRRARRRHTSEESGEGEEEEDGSSSASSGSEIPETPLGTTDLAPLLPPVRLSEFPGTLPVAVARVEPLRQDEWERIAREGGRVHLARPSQRRRHRRGPEVVRWHVGTTQGVAVKLRNPFLVDLPVRVRVSLERCDDQGEGAPLPNHTVQWTRALLEAGRATTVVCPVSWDDPEDAEIRERGGINATVGRMWVVWDGMNPASAVGECALPSELTVSRQGASLSFLLLFFLMRSHVVLFGSRVGW